MIQSAKIFVAFFAALVFATSVSADAQNSDQSSEPISAPLEEQSSTDSSSTSEAPAKADSFSVPVTFREQSVFHIYYSSADAKDAMVKKAKLAGQALEKALRAPKPLSVEARASEVVDAGDRLDVFVRGYKIIDLNNDNVASAGGTNREQYARQLQAEVGAFVSDEMHRLRVQGGALSFFLSVFFALMGFIMLRQVHHGFNKAELILERKRESFKPVALLSETLISGQTVGGLWAVFLVIGRMLAYVMVVLATAGAVLGQFSPTRAIMKNFFADIVSQILKSLQALVEMIPGLLLSLVLIVVLHLALQVLDLFSKSVRSGRVSWSFLTSSRVPVVRFWVTSLLFIFFGPLIIASAFSHFHTPLENIVFLVAVVLALATLPLLANIAAGSWIIWQGKILPGQWIEVRGKCGEVADISLSKITLVPENGGRVFIPMTLLLLNPCIESKSAPRGEFRVWLTRTEGLETSRAKVAALFPPELAVEVVCLSMSAKEYHFSILTPKFRNEIRLQILTSLSEAHEKNQIRLTDTPIEEVTH